MVSRALRWRSTTASTACLAPSGRGPDRSGFTVEDRDRSSGLYFVRYVDPKLADKEEPGFFSKLFGGDKDEGHAAALPWVVKASGARSTVSVQNSQGAPTTATSRPGHHGPTARQN